MSPVLQILFSVRAVATKGIVFVQMFPLLPR